MKPSELFKRGVPFLYFLVLSLPHHQVSQWYEDHILIPAGMDAVQSYSNMISAVLVAGILIYFFVRWRMEGRLVGAALWMATLVMGLIALSDAGLLVNNIERIHFVQYAGLALLFRLTIKDDTLVFFSTAYAGMVDEFQQFLANPAHTSYLDFNDIVFNSLGAALGVLFAIIVLSPNRSFSAAYEARFRKVFYSLVSLTFALAAAALLLGRVVTREVEAAHRRVFSEIDGRLSFIISFEHQKAFWETADNGKSYHILRPWEGVLALAALLPSLWWLVKWPGTDRARRSSVGRSERAGFLNHASEE